MFTGIVQSIGQIQTITPRGGDVEMLIGTAGYDLSSTRIGDSIAVNGCCLTVTRLAQNAFAADVSIETLSLTTLTDWTAGTLINIEPALRAGDALGGHYVTGHVDGVAQVTGIGEDARSRRIEFDAPASLSRYIARKGSVSIDGVSLTVNEVSGTRFGVNLIPHTLEVTILGAYAVGTRANLEVDIIARYLERMQSDAGVASSQSVGTHKTV
jgi:riboflavin synthase